MGFTIPVMTNSLHTPEYAEFCKLLVKLREKSGITQATIAERLGVHQSFVSKYEGGERRVDVIEFLRICKALKADPADVLASLKKRISV